MDIKNIDPAVISPQTVTTPNALNKQPYPSAVKEGIEIEKTAVQNNKITDLNRDQVTLEHTPVSKKSIETLKNLDNLQNRSNELAKEINGANKNVNELTDLVSQMQSSLASITKNFPPFNIESKERQQILMSYISIRQEIIKMTVPPPPEPLYKNVSDIWGNLVDKNGNITTNAVPALQTDSSDNNVKQAEKQLSNTKESLTTISSTINNFKP